MTMRIWSIAVSLATLALAAVAALAQARAPAHS